MTESQIEIVKVIEATISQVLEVVGLSVEVTKQFADMLWAVSWDVDRFSDDELRHIEAGLMQLRANVALCPGDVTNTQAHLPVYPGTLSFAVDGRTRRGVF